MQIQIDSLEASDNPQTVTALKDNGKNEIIIKRLECGDYFCSPCLIEHKTLADYVNSVKTGRIFQQCQDMLYSRQQNFDLKLYIFISGNIADIFNLPHGAQAEPLIAAWASLNRQGVPTIFIGNQWFFTKGMLYLFSKYNDGKERKYNPVRAPITSNDLILNNYQSISWITKSKNGTDIMDGIGEITAKKLKEKFPTPKKLYNATITELQEVEGIGQKTATDLIRFFNGETI